MKKSLQKYRFLLAVIFGNAVMLMTCPQLGFAAWQFSFRSFHNFLFMLTPIFICLGLLDTWIERDTMIRIMGEKSGSVGMLVALLLGVVTAVPLYALLPVAGVLLKKGSRMLNVLLFLSASACVRIPLLLFEVTSLGIQFTLIRFLLNIVTVFASAYIIDKLLTDTDKELIYKNASELQ